MVAHEYAHGEAASRQGDDTAYMLGRLTFNPLKHIDPLMTVIVPFLLWRIGAPPFGAAKPVPVHSRKYRQFRRGGAIRTADRSARSQFPANFVYPRCYQKQPAKS